MSRKLLAAPSSRRSLRPPGQPANGLNGKLAMSSAGDRAYNQQSEGSRRETLRDVEREANRVLGNVLATTGKLICEVYNLIVSCRVHTPLPVLPLSCPNGRLFCPYSSILDNYSLFVLVLFFYWFRYFFSLGNSNDFFRYKFSASICERIRRSRQPQDKTILTLESIPITQREQLKSIPRSSRTR